MRGRQVVRRMNRLGMTIDTAQHIRRNGQDGFGFRPAVVVSLVTPAPTDDAIEPHFGKEKAGGPATAD